MREDDKKIAEWLGWEVYDYIPNEYKLPIVVDDTVSFTDKPFKWEDLPHYTTSDSDAITLLPVLVKRGYYYEMESVTGLQTGFRIGCSDWRDYDLAFHEDPNCCHSVEPSISEAICSAILQLIEKEKER